MRSGSTGRLRSAICTERSSLSRSNGTRRPLRLITTSSRNCTRSKVVKRKPHARHSRRRRIAAEYLVGRESFTCVSRLLQLGQRMPGSPFLVMARHSRSKNGVASLAYVPAIHAFLGRKQGVDARDKPADGVPRGRDAVS